MTSCLICGSPVDDFISFGRMPIANGFLRPEEFVREYFFELKVGFCPQCTMVQLTELVDPEKLFHESYAFFSSTSAFMALHFQEMAAQVRGRYLTGAKPFVVEIGSNDGIMLRHFSAAGIAHLGVEPSANVGKTAMERGVNTVCKFFNAQTAQDILREYGPADAVLGANVMCHIPDLHSVARGVELLLKPEGVLIFEDPYLGDIVERTSYDQIYDEHAFYFSVSSLSHLVDQHDMEIVDIEPQEVHGGSMRYTVARKGRRRPSPAVATQREREAAMGLHELETFKRLRQNIQQSRDELVKLLRAVKATKKRIAGYGATSKSTTVLNYCGIGPDLLDYISDTTPIKQNKFSPGMHVPIKPYETFKSDYPDYALLLAWNHSKEIMGNEGEFRSRGGKWVVYVPAVKVLD